MLPDDSPFTTGGIGDLGTSPSLWAMKNCDTVLILGSTMPWEEYYPQPGQARGVQVDLKPDRLGLRYPAEVGLVGDVKATLRSLLPRLHRKTDRGFLQEAQARMRDWNSLLEEVEATLLGDGSVRVNDILVIISGAPMWVTGTTNLLKLHRVGERR